MKAITVYRHPDCAAAPGSPASTGSSTGSAASSAPPRRPRPARSAWAKSRSGTTAPARSSRAWTPSAQIARQIPAYYPLIPLMWLPPIARAIDRDVRGCEDGRCDLPRHDAAEQHAASRP